MLKNSADLGNTQIASTKLVEQVDSDEQKQTVQDRKQYSNEIDILLEDEDVDLLSLL